MSNWTIVIPCENKNCKFGNKKFPLGLPLKGDDIYDERGEVPDAKSSSVSANYCTFDCAIEAEDWIITILLRLYRMRNR